MKNKQKSENSDYRLKQNNGENKMLYQSTRSYKGEKITASQAIKKGLSDDGGLYMPEFIPQLTQDEIIRLTEEDYAHRAAYILSKFLTDYSYDELLYDCTEAYSSASFGPNAAPLHRINDRIYSLELWHGPTCAFKDMALQIMPRLLSRALTKNNEKRTALILVATSGDTGKAALEGYKNIDGIKIMVFYPQNGVSRVQKLQMATQTGDNVCVYAINGNFDDAQSGVKRIFADEKIKQTLEDSNVFLSSANSINWGRLAPQIAYYVSAYCDLIKYGKVEYGQKIDICVPTGNFGNIFAAYIAKKMGLPLGKFICASNSNNVLTDFLKTGIYDRNRDFHTTISPSMDILISSNLERLLYLIAGPVKTAGYMSELAIRGKYELASEDFEKIRKEFVGFYATEEETKEKIFDVYSEYGYLIDPHTAVGFCACEKYPADDSDSSKCIVLASTASPYKFAHDVLLSLYPGTETDDLSALELLSQKTKTDVPAPLADIGKRNVRFTSVIEKSDMDASVIEFAKS